MNLCMQKSKYKAQEKLLPYQTQSNELLSISRTGYADVRFIISAYSTCTLLLNNENYVDGYLDAPYI